LYPSPNIIRVIIPRGVRWEGNVARMEEEKFLQKFDWKAERRRLI
jgi:hypothetical protein